MKLFEKFKRAVRSGYRKTKTKTAAITAAGALAVGGLGGGAVIESQSDEFQDALKNGASVTQTAKTAANSYLPGADDRAGYDLGKAAEDNNLDKAISTLSYHEDDLDYSDLGKAYIDAAKMGNIDIMKLLDDQSIVEAHYIVPGIIEGTLQGNITPEVFEHVWNEHGDSFSADEISDLLDGLDHQWWKNHKTFDTAIQLIAEKDIDLIPDRHLYEGLASLITTGQTDLAKQLVDSRGWDFESGDFDDLVTSHLYFGQTDVPHFIIEHGAFYMSDQVYNEVFDVAANNGMADTVGILLDSRGWKLNHTTLNQGLKDMAANGDVESIKVLLTDYYSHKIAPSVLDEALKAAQDAGHDEAAELIQKGIDSEKTPGKWYYQPILSI